MDAEQEEVVNLIFGGHPPENWQDNPEFSLYLAELGNIGPDRVATEPDRVTEELTQLQAQTQELAFSNYKTFIQTSNCSREIFTQFQTTESHLQQLLEKLPNFTSHCHEFQAAAADISRHRRLTSLTLSKHTSLLEILELPQLMDTVVRNQHYEEALQLHSYVNRLAKKLPTVPIIEDISKNVDNSMKLMLGQLLGQLRSPVQLPQCLKVISYLRRMDVFGETELRLKFLQARDTWLRSVLAGVAKDDPYIHVTRTMEVMRVHLFDIVTQYRAIFSEEESLMSSLPNQFDNRLLFTAWINRKIVDFLRVLETDLAHGVTSLESVISQAMYFGLSFSRVGFDFRQQLSPLFTGAVERQFSSAVQLNLAATQLSASLAKLHLARISSLASPQPGYSSSVLDATQPPLQLIDYPPLAELCNIVLSGLNEIRLCAPLTVTNYVTGHIQKLLEAFSGQMSDFHAAASPGWGDKETAGFEQLVSAMSSLLLPYLQKCLSAIFLPAELTSVLGLSTGDLKARGIGYIKQDLVMEPLNQFLPLPVDSSLLVPENEAQTVYVADRIEELAQAAEDEAKSEAVVEAGSEAGEAGEYVENCEAQKEVGIEASEGISEDKGENEKMGITEEIDEAIVESTELEEINEETVELSGDNDRNESIEEKSEAIIQEIEDKDEMVKVDEVVNKESKLITEEDKVVKAKIEVDKEED